ncbi:MAG: type II toxin-antitoxin system ParD family antitoxin [Thermomicrobiales bacterium]
MELALDEQDERIIRQHVATGEYGDASEVVHEALIALDERRRMRLLRQAVDVGLDDRASGAVTPWSRSLLSELRTEAEEHARLGTPIDSDVQG